MMTLPPMLVSKRLMLDQAICELVETDRRLLTDCAQMLRKSAREHHVCGGWADRLAAVVDRVSEVRLVRAHSADERLPRMHPAERCAIDDAIARLFDLADQLDDLATAMIEQSHRVYEFEPSAARVILTLAKIVSAVESIAFPNADELN